MEIQDVQGETYKISCEMATGIVNFQGWLRLEGMTEYAPIVDLLNQLTANATPTITINLKELQFLNSSGINMLSKFVIDVRKKKNIQLVVKGSEGIPWQSRSLKNLQRLMPDLKLEFE